MREKDKILESGNQKDEWSITQQTCENQALSNDSKESQKEVSQFYTRTQELEISIISEVRILDEAEMGKSFSPYGSLSILSL